MIIGLLLALSISATLASFGLIALGSTDAIKINYMTGAVVGVNQVVDYSVTIFFVSLIVTLTLVSIIKKRHS